MPWKRPSTNAIIHSLFTTIGRRLWSAAAAIDIAMIDSSHDGGSREELQPARLNVMVWATVNIVTTLVTRQSAEAFAPVATSW